jgi:hypothetical protein
MKYLFTATFADGHTIEQTQTDKSELVPPDESGNGKSAFYDVLNYSGELETFTLSSETEPNKIVVHLKTGDIFVDGEARNLEPKLSRDIKREVVYFRQMLFEYGGSLCGDLQIAAFIVGWKTKVDDDQEMVFAERIT